MNHDDLHEKYDDGAAGQRHYRKPRLFVREISGFTYCLDDALKRLRSLPRVIKGRDMAFKKGPQYFNCTILSPKNGTSQSIYSHMVVIAPGGKSQKHGHVNEACFYILDGKGYDVHDGKQVDWKAGDVAIVPNATVHQHFNADPDRPVRALIIKSKPFFLFMNMLFQDVVEDQPKTPVPGHEDFQPSPI